MTAAVTVGAVGVLIAGLVGLLRLGRAAGERLRRDSTDLEPAYVRPAVADEPGALSEEERVLRRWVEEATERDLARLAAVHKVFQHECNVLFEQALSYLKLDVPEQNWARAACGGDAMSGIR